MAQFDVYRTTRGEWVLDCQADLLASYNSRIVAPLLRPQEAPPIMPRLNPRFHVAGEERVLMIEFLAAVPVAMLGSPVSSLAEHDYAIRRAIDMLITGF